MLKILVIRFSSLGDLVLCSPVFRELKKVFPESHVTFLTSKQHGQILDNNPYIDQVTFHPRRETFRELNQLAEQLNQQSFDIIYDIHCSLRSRWICWNMKSFFQRRPPVVWKINKRGWQRTILILWKLNLLRNGFSQREVFLHPLQSQTSQPLACRTELFPSSQDKTTVKNYLRENRLDSGRLICIGPSASVPGKRWPLTHYQSLVSKLLAEKWQIVLIGGDKEEESKRLKQYFGEDICNLAGKLTPLGSAALLEQARLVVCNDTSIAHIAEAMNTPAIAIFGPTVREFGYFPYLEKSVAIEMNLPCRPCSRTGKGECKITQKRLCLTSISPQLVFNRVVQITQSVM